MAITATIIVPTTGDRGPLLKYSVGSILRQTVQDFEVFIIGDGVSAETRRHIAELLATDARIRFFDFPKSERRGELHRDQLIRNEARGLMIAYLCDRDLMLPDHLETLQGLLGNHDFAATCFFNVLPDQNRMNFSRPLFIGDARQAGPAKVRAGFFSLSVVGHTMAMYKKLPHGWRTTPKDVYTDVYMWRQFLAHPECRAFSSPAATILYFSREDRPDWTVERRLAELVHYHDLSRNREAFDRMKKAAQEDLLADYVNKTRSLLLIKGVPWTRVPTHFGEKIKRLARRLSAR